MVLSKKYNFLILNPTKTATKAIYLYYKSINQADQYKLGWHSDIELENYLIENDLGETIELQTPMVSTLDIFYRLSHNVLLGVGPGLTVENGEMKTLMRVGIEGEVPMNDRWEWTPTLYLDQRIDGHQVWTFAVGVAHYL